MALSRSMAIPNTILTHRRTVILSVLLLAIVTSGFSQIELHTHAAADLGHVHDVHDNDGTDGADPSDIVETGKSGVMHAHDIGASAPALVPVIGVNVVAHWRAEGRTSPPTARPPDILIVPLHRPPIV